jgi:hypothetical protein
MQLLKKYTIIRICNYICLKIFLIDKNNYRDRFLEQKINGYL